MTPRWRVLFALFGVACSHVEAKPRVAERERAKPRVNQPEATRNQPAPPPFEGQEWVSFDQLVSALDRAAEVIARSAAVRGDYRALIREHGLDDTPELWSEYVRVRMVFEAARDGGFWGLRW